LQEKRMASNGVLPIMCFNCLTRLDVARAVTNSELSCGCARGSETGLCIVFASQNINATSYRGAASKIRSQPERAETQAAKDERRFFVRALR